MSCGSVGDIPSVQETCSSACEIKAGPDGCALSPCACASTGDVCGDSLPLNCGYDPKAIYTCLSNGTIAQEKQACPSPQVCSLATTGPICTPQECLCSDNSTLCGSAHPPSCNLLGNSLYSCTSGNLPKATTDCRPGTCSGDKCIDKCACQVAGELVSEILNCYDNSCRKPWVATTDTLDLLLRYVLRRLINHVATTTRLL